MLLRVLLAFALLLFPQLGLAQTYPVNAHLAVAGHINTCSTNPSGGTDTYACALDSHITALEPKACYGFVADVSNTGAASITFAGLGGARTIVKASAGLPTALVDNDIRAGMIVHVCWDGTNMQCQNCLGNAPTGSGTPAGSTGTAQYNNAGAFGGSTGLGLNATTITSAADRITTLSASKNPLDTTDGPVIACDATLGNVTATLPDGTTTLQRRFTIVKIDTSAFPCIIAPNAIGTDTINGVVGNATLTARWDRYDVTLLSTAAAANWAGAYGLEGAQFSRRYVTLECVADAAALSSGDGACYWPVPADLNGWVIVGASAHVGAAVSSTGVVTIDADRCGAVATGIRCSGTNVAIFQAAFKLVIDANEDGTETAATAAQIDTANDDLATGQWVRWNIDGAGTGTQGLYVTLAIQKP